VVEAVPAGDRAAEVAEAGVVEDSRAADRVMEPDRTADRRQEPLLNVCARIAGITKSISEVFPVTG